MAGPGEAEPVPCTMRSVLLLVPVCLLAVAVAVSAEKLVENSVLQLPTDGPKQKPLDAEVPTKTDSVKETLEKVKEQEAVLEDVNRKEQPKPTEDVGEPQKEKLETIKQELVPEDTNRKEQPKPTEEKENEDTNRTEQDDVPKLAVESADPIPGDFMSNAERIQNQEEQENVTKVTYDGVKVLRVVIQNKEQKKMLRQLENKGDINTWSGNGTAVDILIRQERVYNILKDKKLVYDVIIDDLQKAIEEENPPIPEDEWSELEGRKAEPYTLWPRYGFFSPYRFWLSNDVDRFRERTDNDDGHFQGYRKTKRKKKKKKRRGHRMTWQMYHRMSDIHGYIDYLTATYPDTCSQETIGYSIEGRPLKVLKISSGEPNSNAMWVDSGIHAREWITPASSTYAISQMVENGDGTHGVDWYFLPLVNPDGYEHSHTTDRLWRKNRANSYKGPCAGTDLNRNFGYRWGGQGSSQQPCRETYAGPSPFSEPETNAINKFVTSKSKELKAYVSLHSYGQYILYPWGYDRKVPPDYSDLHRVGRSMAQAMRNSGGQIYRVGSAAATLYPASGGSDDWAKGVAKIKYTYTIELRDTGRHGFVLPAQYIQPTAKEAYAALKTLAEEVKQL